MRRFVFFVIMIFLYSCSKEDKKFDKISIQKNNIKMFFPEYYRLDTLFLDVQIDNCGEWGGPEDKFKIFRDSLLKFKMEYSRHKLNCDSLSWYYGKQKPIEYKKSITLSQHQQNLIAEFFVYMMKAKIQEKGQSHHSASMYRLYNSDSTLTVNIASINIADEEKFYSIKRDLGLPENRRKTPAPVTIDVR